MNHQEKVLAISRAYALFSEIYARGITGTLLPVLQQLPGMPAIEGPAPEEYAASHFQLFGQGVYPYASVFLEEDGLLGGSVTETASAFYVEFGYLPNENESPDHIAAELSALAFLSGAQSDAEADGATYHIQRIRHLQRRFLDEHLLLWLPALVNAVQQQPETIYHSIAEQTLDLVLTHRQMLGDELAHSASGYSLPDAPDLMVQEKTSLKDIANYLLTPVYTGFYLSHDDITRLGSAFRLPHGFGSRKQMFSNLLRTAADYDAFGLLISEIEKLITRWLVFYQAQSLLSEDVKQVWLQRLNQTRELLLQIKDLSERQQNMFEEDIDTAIVAQGGALPGCAARGGTDDCSI